MAIDYYLVSASRRAYRLRVERPYVFGREEGCDIVLQDALASRRHAEVTWYAEGTCWVLKDLNSRNGVMVNGTRITQPTQLDDGCQIQIGGQVYRMHLLPPGGDPGSLGNQAPQISTLETLGPGFSMQDLASQGATYTGQVTSGLLDLLQFFLTTAKSGRLDLLGGSAGSAVHLVTGTPVHASDNGQTGIDAMVSLALNPPPRFAFHADAPAPERTLQGSANGILMEVARMLDEKGKV
jgi:hypothetical protein